MKSVGGFFKNTKSKEKKHYSFEDVVKNTKKSEGKLIKTYEEMDNATRTYTKAYTDHLENLEILDEYAHFNGMVTLFKKILMKDNIKTGNIDKSNPILFKNYMIEGEVMPSTLRAEHIKRQIDYLRNKFFALRDNAFISFISISDITKTSFVCNIITIDNKKYNRKIEHEDYIVNKSEIKSALKEIIYTTKRNLKRDSQIIVYDEDTIDSSSKQVRSIRSVKSSKKNRTITKHNTTKSKHTKQKSVKDKSQSQGKNINIFATNSKKGISHLDRQIQNILKSNKKRSLFSIEKGKTIRDKEYKAKKDAEEKAKALLNPPSQDEIIEKKCSLYGSNKQMCEADKDCYATPYDTCKKSNRPPMAIQGQQAILPPAPPGGFELDAKAF